MSATRTSWCRSTTNATVSVVVVTAVVLTSIAFPSTRADEPEPRRSRVADWWHKQSVMFRNRHRAKSRRATSRRQPTLAKTPTQAKRPTPPPALKPVPRRVVRKVVAQAPQVPANQPSAAPMTAGYAQLSAPAPALAKRPTPPPALAKRPTPPPALKPVPRRAIRKVVAQAPRVPANQPPAAPTTAGYAQLNAPLYPAPLQNIPHQVGGTVITNPALAPHEMLYEHEYRALYPPFYYRVNGWWAWTPFGVESHDKWELMGTEVRVQYRSRSNPVQNLIRPLFDPFLD